MQRSTRLLPLRPRAMLLGADRRLYLPVQGRAQRRAAQDAPVVGRTLRLAGQLGALHVERWLGSGGVGDIYAVRLLGRAGLWALKVTPLTRLSKEELLRASLLQGRCLSPRVLRAFTPHFQGAYGYTLLERAAGPSLELWLQQHFAHQRAPLPAALLAWISMAEAVLHCHRAGVVHQDVKPDNFLLTSLQAPLVSLKLGDFDAARNLHGAVGATTTVAYLAPEALAGAPASFAADVWSLGVSFFRLLVGIEPFYDLGEPQIVARLQTDRPAFGLADAHAVLHVDGHAAGVRHQVLNFLRGALARDANARLPLPVLLSQAKALLRGMVSSRMD